MPEPMQLLRGVIERHQPRSILGFMFAMSALVVGALVVLAIAALGADRYQWLALPLIAVMLLIPVVVMIAVFSRAKDDPGSLLLTNVSAREYAALQWINLGDDESGERAERILGSTVIDGSAVEEETHQLEGPAAPDPEDQA